ncbi:hypothetical protein FB45DRAFT_139826 [Roridomyces roridus]|uniref:Uncharacterized protein n=1 Tax=Roridomyces roridus TaxID=1738132 RepID=A0AAD7FFS3_9AGAR|nr:hypothetical protein FB45DRAFT_139826 [Roridomyces roridus]
MLDPRPAYIPQKTPMSLSAEADLTALGIPHPKRSNVSIVYPGTVRFYWTAAPHSAIRKKLTSSLQPPHNMEQEKIFKERYIKRIDLKESKAKPGSNQAPKPNSNSNDPSKAQTELPFHFLPNPDASFSAIPMSGYSPEQILPPRTSEKGKEKENGDDSDDVVAMENGGVPPLSLSQRPFSVMKVKPEPTEVPIPAVSAWNYNSSGKVEPMGDVDMPPVRVVGSWNSAEWVRPPETEPNEGEKWAYSRPLRNSSEWVKPPEAKHREADNWSDSQPLWRFKRRSPRWADSRYGAEVTIFRSNIHPFMGQKSADGAVPTFIVSVRTDSVPRSR